MVVNEPVDAVRGAPGGANIAFTVPEDAARTVFLYDSVSHLLTVTSG